jgi:hypothetical protein
MAWIPSTCQASVTIRYPSLSFHQSQVDTPGNRFSSQARYRLLGYAWTCADFCGIRLDPGHYSPMTPIGTHHAMAACTDDYDGGTARPLTADWKP